MDSRFLLHPVLWKQMVSLMLRDIWVPDSFTYPISGLLQYNRFAVKLVECSCVLLGRIILSPLLLLVKNCKPGEKNLKLSLWAALGWQTLSWLCQGTLVIPLFRNAWDGCSKALSPLPRALGTVASYPLSSGGTRTPVKQGFKMLGIALMGEEDNQWSVTLENIFPWRRPCVWWAERRKGGWGMVMVLLSGMGSIGLSTCLSPAGKHALRSGWQR